jgi:hypothetical protein
VIAIGFLGLSQQSDGTAPLWPGLVALFGFLDGFVLPAVLPPAQLSQRLQLRLLSSFDLGALLLEVLVIGLAVACWWLLRSRRITLPQALLQDVGAAGLSGLGAFWLLSRLG